MLSKNEEAIATIDVILTSLKIISRRKLDIQETIFSFEREKKRLKGDYYEKVYKDFNNKQNNSVFKGEDENHLNL